MSQERDLDISIVFSPESQKNQVSQAELGLLSSILPDLIKAMAIEVELNKE